MRRRTEPAVGTPLSFDGVSLPASVTRDLIPADVAEREAVLYPDPSTNYIHVERGKAAVRVLESLGVAVRVPKLPSTGRAPLSQGMVETTRGHARHLAMLRRDYDHLLSDPDPLRENSYELLEYVYGLLENGANADALSSDGTTRRVTYHAHCQARTLGIEPYTVAVLERLGYDVETTDAECCEMAGSFGYKADYYDLSVAVGESLSEEIADEIVLASGASCSEQLDALPVESPRHPVELLNHSME
ncbi:hypothetical protein [Haladaptatus halobius]|uniref:hypothetical protein n=1 Tax=Haladaptatus halobius TaxID=2884875 RepID=UPI003F5E8C4E